MICYIVWALTFALTYTERSATITGATIDSSQANPTYYLAYRYADAGGVFDSEAAAPAEVYRQQNVRGEHTSVRVFALGPMSGQTLALANPPWGLVFFLIPFAGFWNFIIGSRLLDLWRKQRLVRFGRATTGTITRLYYVPGRHGGSTHAEYSFVDPASGATIAAKMQVDGANFGGQPYRLPAAKGWHWQGSKVDLPVPQAFRTVTVLYDAGNPKRSIAYEYSGVEVALAPGRPLAPPDAE